MRTRPSLPPAMCAERGSLVLEVVWAVFLLAVGMLATLGVLDGSDHLTTTTQRQQAATAIAEQQMESLRSMSYANLVLSKLPTHTADGNAVGDSSGNPTNPDYWVSASNILVVQNWNSESSSAVSGVASTGEALDYGTTGTVDPGPVTVSNDGYTATVYRFVSWVNDRCVYLLADLCPGTEDAKRVTVAVVLGSGGRGVTKPVWLSTVVADPQAGIDLL